MISLKDKAKRLLGVLSVDHYLRAICEAIVAGKEASHNSEAMICRTFDFYFGKK